MKESWREMPFFAKALVIATIANTLMLIYDTRFISDLNSYLHLMH